MLMLAISDVMIRILKLATVLFVRFAACH